MPDPRAPWPHEAMLLSPDGRVVEAELCPRVIGLTLDWHVVSTRPWTGWETVRCELLSRVLEELVPLDEARAIRRIWQQALLCFSDGGRALFSPFRLQEITLHDQQVDPRTGGEVCRVMLAGAAFGESEPVELPPAC